MHYANVNVNLMVEYLPQNQKQGNDKCRCEYKNPRKHHA